MFAVFTAAGQNPSALSMENPAFAGFSPASMSPTTSQHGIQGAFGVGNPVCQNRQSHEPNSSKKIGPSGDGTTKRLGLYIFSFNYCSLIAYFFLRLNRAKHIFLHALEWILGGSLVPVSVKM